MLKHWKKYKLQDIVDQERGISYGIVQPGNHDPLGVPILKVNNLTNRSFSQKDFQSVSSEIEGKYHRTRLKGGELLISLVGSLGEIFLVPEDMIGMNVVRAIAVVPVLEEYSPKWVQYWLRSPFAQNQLEQIATTSVQATINLKELREIEIPFPEIAERDCISSILSVLDDKIELNLQMNKTLEEMAMTLYKHWFVDFGPFRDEELVSSELGEIPKGWEVKKILETNVFISDFVSNGSFKSLKDNVTLYEDRKEFALFVRNTDLKSSFQRDLKYVDESAYKFLSKTKLFGKEIIISNVGDVGSVYLCPSFDYPMTLGNNVIMLKAGSFNNYIYRFFLSEYGQHLIAGITGGSAQPKFNKTDFRNLKIIIPDLVIIEKFNSIIEPIQDQIFGNNSEIQTLTTLRDTLLPKLISGEVRVKDAARSLAEVL